MISHNLAVLNYCEILNYCERQEEGTDGYDQQNKLEHTLKQERSKQAEDAEDSLHR